MATEPYDDQKRFMEEMILRFEKAFRRVDESMSRHMEKNSATLDALIRQIEEHRIEFREEYEAQRGTLLRILDYIHGDGPATTS